MVHITVGKRSVPRPARGESVANALAMAAMVARMHSTRSTSSAPSSWRSRPRVVNLTSEPADERPGAIPDAAARCGGRGAVAAPVVPQRRQLTRRREMAFSHATEPSPTKRRMQAWDRGAQLLSHRPDRGHATVRNLSAFAGNATCPPSGLIDRLKLELEMLAGERHSYANSALVYNESVSTPSNLTRIFVERDRALISELSLGKMREFSDAEWDGVLDGWEKSMHPLLSKFSASRIFINSKTNAPRQDVDIDEILDVNNTDGIFLHDERQVLFATLSCSACVSVRDKIAVQSAINTDMNDIVFKGMRDILKKDHTQEKLTRGNQSLRCVNFGSAMRPQTRNCQEHASLVGSRHVKVDSRAILAAQRQSFDRQVREWYRRECLPVFFCSNTETKDRFYRKSLVAPRRQPRIPKSGGLDVSTSHRHTLNLARHLSCVQMT